jgi:uncharacterized protein (DUF1684 family)
MSEKEISEHRDAHAQQLADTSYGKMNQDEIDHFGGLDYFDFDANYQITATFTKNKGKVFEMLTSTDRKPKYRRFGYVDFEVDGVKCRLEVYQNMKLKKKKEYKNYLFIPFRDGTSSKETYGGGRYLDVRIPDGKSVLLDFNLLYNPYCAYSHRYSCPIPPEANTLKVEILAGEKTPLGH